MLVPASTLKTEKLPDDLIRAQRKRSCPEARRSVATAPNLVDNLIMGDRVEKARKQSWEMSYDELFEDWSSRYSFGAKGELTPQEAKAIHEKWKSLGTQARLGLL